MRAAVGSVGRFSLLRGGVFGDLVSGSVCGLTTATFAISYAALVYSGSLSVGRSAGFVAMLTACLIAGLGTALLSSLSFAATSPDGNTIVILAAMAAEIGRGMGPSASPAAVSATILTMMMLAAVATGAVMATLGVMRAGRVVRFIPYQVMAGFLGASGWFLTLGGAVVGLGMPWHLAVLAEPDALAKLSATIVIGVSLLVLVPRSRSPFALPGIVAVTAGLYHVIAAGMGISVVTQAQLGWLLRAPSNLSLSIPWSPATLRLVDWHVLEASAPGLLAVVLVAVISLMLNVSALEVASAKDADIDRELRAGGLSAVASGLLGGAPANVSLSRSLLLLRAGATTRLAPSLSAVLAGLAPLLWPSALGFVPRPVLGGLLIFLGLQLLIQWVVRSRRYLSTAEWLTVVLVVAITIRFGFVVGVFAGVALGCANFALSYSRAAPTRARYRGDLAASYVSRPASDRALLHADAEALLVLHLQGFLFFGTANRLLADVRAEIAAMPGRLRFLVLDFRSVDGLDGSALSSFARIVQIAAAERIAVVLAATPATVATRLGGLAGGADTKRHAFANLDQALEWCEETRLAELKPVQAAPADLQQQLELIFGEPDTVARFIARLDQIVVAPGIALMEQGELSDDLMFIETGRVSIILRPVGAPEVRARSMGVGSMIGEIGFLLGEPRTATVRAETHCRIRRLTRVALERIEQEDPDLGFAFHRAMAQLLAHRLIDKDGMIAALMRSAR